ncbi:MAG TPA: ABC transporter permease [Gaiellales bacterium]|nr:ABC transporter permease [Gaiellales bacterium]
MITFARYEIVRTLRNRRFFIFSVGFPVVLYFTIAGPNRNEHNFANSGLPAALYYMVGLTAFGTMNTVLSTGTRIAGERSAGWNRQLRLTPLSTRNYFRTKVAVAYLMACITIAVLYASGISLGVSLAAGEWARMTGLILVGLIPFVALGVLMGHLLTTDSIGPAMGGTTALLSLLGGVWFPVNSGTFHDIAEALPSFWLVQASHVSIGGGGWSARGWIIMAAWAVGLAAAAGWAYRRDTQRV